MSTNIYGNPDINMDFEYNKNYNLMINFQKNTTNQTYHIKTVTDLQIANDTIVVINSTTNETYKEELLAWYYYLTRLRTAQEGTWDNPFLEDSIYQLNYTSFEDIYNYRLLNVSEWVMEDFGNTTQIGIIRKSDALTFSLQAPGWNPGPNKVIPLSL